MTNFSTGDLNRVGKRLARQIFQIQLGIWGVISVIAFILWSRDWAIACCFGAVTAILPQRIFSLMTFTFGGARSAYYSVRAFQLGESIKLLLTMVMLLLIFTCSGAEPKVVLLSYMIVMLPAWFGPLILKT